VFKTDSEVSQQIHLDDSLLQRDAFDVYCDIAVVTSPWCQNSAKNYASKYAIADRWEWRQSLMNEHDC
jgi:hypothetical protein